MTLTSHEAHELLVYDKATGLFTWRERTSGPDAKRWNSRYAGRIAGSPNPDGYILIKIKRRRYMAHRVAWLMIKGEWPASEIDHQDRERANNAWENLRPASRSENMTNRKSAGVYRHSRNERWCAQLTANGVQQYLGSFATKEAALEARAAAVNRAGLSEWISL